MQENPKLDIFVQFDKLKNYFLDENKTRIGLSTMAVRHGGDYSTLSTQNNGHHIVAAVYLLMYNRPFAKKVLIKLNEWIGIQQEAMYRESSSASDALDKKWDASNGFQYASMYCERFVRHFKMMEEALEIKTIIEFLHPGI